MSKFLSRMGHHVTVCTHSDRKSDECFSDDLIRIRDISHNMYRQGWRKIPWFLMRVYSEILNRTGQYHSIYSWWKRRVLKHSDRIIRTAKPDLILVTYPPVETLEIGCHLSGSHDIPLVSDFRDGLIFEPVEFRRMNRFSCVRKFYRDLEARTVEVSSALVTASPPITEYFLRRYGAPPVITVLNGYDPDDFRGIPRHPAVRRQYFNMVFTGKFSASDVTCRIRPFVEALSAAVEEDPDGAGRFRLHLVGQLTASEKRLFRKLSDSGPVVIHGECSRDEALSFQNSADMFLLITSVGRSSVITSKFFEYVYFQKPILALTHRTQVAEMIAPMDDSEVIHPEDTGGITEFFRSLFREIKNREKNRKNQGYRDRFSFENSASSLDQFLKNILKKD